MSDPRQRSSGERLAVPGRGSQLAPRGPDNVNGPTKLPLHPSHPERICWGCNKRCPADDLTCGNGSERSPHPAELFGEDWYEWTPGQDDKEQQAAAKVVDLGVVHLVLRR